MAALGGALASGVSRRHFIVGTSSVAAAVYVLGPNGAVDVDPAGALRTLVSDAKRLLSVGFVRDSAGKGGAALEKGAVVVPASQLRSGDGSLRGTVADVGVHGLTPGHDRAAMPSVFVDAMFPSPTPLNADNLVPFYAWSLASSPTQFSVLMERTPRLGFSVTAAGRTASAAFTTGRHAGMTPLREGVYLLGLAPGVWDRPRALPDLEDAGSWAGLVSAIVSVSAPQAEPESAPAP